MPASAGTTRTLLFDTNVFVAAVKHRRRETASLRLIFGLLRRAIFQVPSAYQDGMDSR